MVGEEPRHDADGTSIPGDQPKFLLVANADEQISVSAPIRSEASEPDGSDESMEDADSEFPDSEEADWPDREDIRDGLMVHVQERFGIDPDVAERAINDILRIA